MNIIFTIFDYISFFFILTMAFHDDVGLGIAITDAVLFFIFMFFLSFRLWTITYSSACYARENEEFKHLNY